MKQGIRKPCFIQGTCLNWQELWLDLVEGNHLKNAGEKGTQGQDCEGQAGEPMNLGFDLRYTCLGSNLTLAFNGPGTLSLSFKSPDKGGETYLTCIPHEMLKPHLAQSNCLISKRHSYYHDFY
jgi:hypothetical protein